MSPVMSKLGPDPSTIQGRILQEVPNINGLKKICNSEEKYDLQRSDCSSAK